MSKLCFPEKVLEQHVVVLGKTGSGKSSALRHMVEYLLTHKKRVVVIDPKGDWWGLKSSADGKKAGFPVVAFGDFKEAKATDIPLNAQSGKQVAELIAAGNRPCIIGFRGWMPGQMTKFWIDFASTLFNAKAGDLYLVIDEVHNFAAKGKILDPEAGRCIHWTNRIMAEGRGLGITCLIASQRPQKVHNDTLTACETLVAMRVIHEADRSALKEWIDGCGDKAHGKEVLENVGNMARGDAFVWSPEIGFGPTRLHFPLFETFDSFAPPKLQQKIYDSGWSEIDLEEIKTKLASILEEKKANDPVELKKQVADLRKQLAAKSTSTNGAALKTVIETKRVEVPVLKEGQLQRAENIVASLSATIEKGKEWIGLLATSMQKVNTAAPVAAQMKPQMQVPIQRAVKIPRPSVEHSNTSEQLTRSQQNILNALAWLESIRINSASRTIVAFIAGVSSKSSGYSNNISALRTSGYLEYPQQNIVALTEEGRAIADQPDVPLTSDVLHQSIYKKLTTSQTSILKCAIEHYPESISREELAEEISVSSNSSGFSNNISSLRTFGFIGYPQQGYVVAEPLLFID